MPLRRIISFFRNRRRKINQKEEQAKLLAYKKAEALLKRRIFTNRQATDGSSLGTYKSDQHKKLRRSKGRQIQEKDLFLEGDLFRSIAVGRNSRNELVLGFNRDRFKKIAEGQQRQTGKTIFQLSSSEVREVTEVFANEWIKAVSERLK